MLLKKTTVLLIHLTAFLTLTALSANADSTSPVVTPGPAPANAPAYTLRYKFFVGETLDYQSTMDTTSGLTNRGNLSNFKTSFLFASNQTIQSVSPTDGSAVMSTNITSMSATINGNPFPVPHGSALINKPFSMTMSPTGGIISTSNLSADPAFAALTGGLTKVGSPLPTQPVKVGDTWSLAVPLPGLGSIMNSVSTLKSVTTIKGDNVAEIDSILSSSPSGNNSQSPSSPLKSASMSGNSVVLFDLDKGQMTSFQTSAAITMMRPPSSDGTNNPPITITTTMKMSLITPVAN